MFTTRVSIFVSLVAFALLGNIVTAEKAFVITAYYNILRQTMTVFFPQGNLQKSKKYLLKKKNFTGIGQFAETLVSIKRIQKYMMYDEKLHSKTLAEHLADDTENGELSSDTKLNKSSQDDIRKSAAHLSAAGIQVTNIKARWDSENTEYTLNDVNLRVQPGTLVAIIGPVGSGKSSLIQAILGELSIESGTIDVNGIISYASQEPWLFSGTVRTNILFGQPMNRDRYKQVVKKCALERDFALLPNGDKTIVGERGQSLSGGQKARISLARACYRNAGIYLLDDPLSAVDTHVGKHLFDQCLRDLLRNNIVILVTHQLQYLQHVDQIVIFNHGKVEAVGTYESLRETGLDFAKLLADPSKEEKNDESSLSRSRSGSRLNRQSSEASNTSLEEKPDENPIQNEEKRSDRAIGLSLYSKYFKAGGGFFFFYVMLFFCIFAQILASGGDFFLTYW